MQLEFLEPNFNEINMIINFQKNNKAPEEDGRQYQPQISKASKTTLSNTNTKIN